MTHPREYIEKFCDDLKQKMLEKWDAGAKEHGNDWQGVDCLGEVGEELLDIFNYFCIQKAQEDAAKDKH